MWSLYWDVDKNDQDQHGGSTTHKNDDVASGYVDKVHKTNLAIVTTKQPIDQP